MHCPNCKAELKDGSRFCSKCGSRIEPGAAQEQGGPAASVKRQGEASRTPPAPGKGGPGPGAALLALLVVLALAGGAGVFIHFGSKKDQAVLESVRSEFAGAEDEEPEMDASLEGEAEASAKSSTAQLPTEGAAVPETSAASTEAAALPETAAMPTEAATLPQTAAMPTGVPPATAYGGQGTSQNQKIQYIRDAYNRIVANLGSYRQEGGNYYDGNGMLMKSVVSSGNAAIDSAMRSNGYTTYSLEYYYDDQNAASYPIFIFAVIDGKEYRYYFEGGNFIRRVGPEGSVNDSPEMNSFITTLRDEGYVDR